MTKNRYAAEQQAFDHGRHARGSAIGRDQSPLTGPLRDTWQEGWDAEDGFRQPDAKKEERVAKVQAKPAKKPAPAKAKKP